MRHGKAQGLESPFFEAFVIGDLFPAGGIHPIDVDMLDTPVGIDGEQEAVFSMAFVGVVLYGRGGGMSGPEIVEERIRRGLPQAKQPAAFGTPEADPLPEIIVGRGIFDTPLVIDGVDIALPVTVVDALFGAQAILPGRDHGNSQ